MELKNKKILIIVGGGISAYKSLDLIRLLIKNNVEVKTILTKSGKEFVTPLSITSLTKNKTFEDNGSNAQISKLGIEETNKVSIENHNSIEKDDWEKVLFALRRVKFGKMVLGGLLRNVEIPKKIDDKLTLKFKSKHLHDLFKAEWKIDLAREAVRNAVIKVYGEKIKLVLEEPEDEKKNNIDEKNILDSSIVKSALAMGAKIEEEKEG